MAEKKEMGFATQQIHVGKCKENTGSLCTPIYQTATFEFDSVQQGGARFAGKEPGYIYTRLGNPSLTAVEEKVAALEKGEAGMSTASGMGAISSALWTLLAAGDELISSDTLYGCTYSLMTKGLTKFGVKVILADLSDLNNLQKNLSPKTKVVYFETPCNPTLKVLDIEKISKMAHDYNPEIKVVVDNTFNSPYLQNPLVLGADVVVHSATKYINGHGDVIAGFVVGKKDFIDTCKMTGLKDMTGAIMSPFSAFLLARGLKTLDIRMQKHCSNAKKLVEYFKSSKAIKKIYYPGVEDFPGHEIAKRQMRDYGGMMSIELNANRDTTAKVINSLKLCTIAVSLGDAETLVEHPASMTHSTYSAEELAQSGIAEGLVRISVGLEDVNDIIADFDQAFAQIK